MIHFTQKKTGHGQCEKISDFFSGNTSKILLFFYPKDNTPGCTNEARELSALYDQFLASGIQVVGISRDSLESHDDFIQKHDLQMPLISDPDLVLHKQFRVWGEKKNYGKIIEGVIRSTFLLDDTQEILQEWRNVRASGHAGRLQKELI